MIELVTPRKVMKIEVLPQAKLAIEAFAEKYQMKEYAVASKIYEWFALQDDLFQRSVIGMLHGLEVDAAKHFMARVAELGVPTGDQEWSDRLNELQNIPRQSRQGVSGSVRDEDGTRAEEPLKSAQTENSRRRPSK